MLFFICMECIPSSLFFFRSMFFLDVCNVFLVLCCSLYVWNVFLVLCFSLDPCFSLDVWNVFPILCFSSDGCNVFLVLCCSLDGWNETERSQSDGRSAPSTPSKVGPSYY